MAKSVGEVESEANFDKLARHELAQLHRQYRVMETDRQNFIHGKGLNLSRQGRMVAYLKNEKSDLLTDLENVMSATNQKKDKESEEVIAAMLEAYFKCIEQIQSQIDEIVQLESQVDKITKKVIAQKLKTQAIFGRSMTVGQSTKRLRVLENRKYYATTQFDIKVTENGYLREDINLSLMERGRFHDRFRQLKRQIAAAKHKMLLVVDSALTSYEAREEAIMKMHVLRDRNDKESQKHVLEIKQYQRVFHHDQKLRLFMKIKNQSRDVVEKSEERSQRITNDKDRQLDELIRQYKKSFAQILSLARTKDVETLLHQYLKQEQANFSSFKYITDLNNETCVLEQTIRDLKTQIEMTVSTAKKGHETRANNLNELYKINQNSKIELSGLIDTWEFVQKNMQKIIHSIDVIFDQAQCANAPVIQLLGNRSGILPRNLILCLKVLENRIGELQYQRNVLQIRKAVLIDKTPLPYPQSYWQPGKKPPPSGGPFKANVHLTGMSNDMDEEDEENERQMSMRRMTHQEIKQFYKAKLEQESTPTPDPDPEILNDSLSLSDIPTKPKFAPPIKTQPLTATSNENSKNEGGTIENEEIEKNDLDDKIDAINE